MLQCFYDYFILNEKVKPCSEFDNQLFSEGRSIYEVFRIIDGIPLFYLEHIKRLFKSSEILSFDIRLDEETIKQNVQRLIEINAVRKGNVEIIFNKQNKDHSKETFLALFIENRYPIEEQYRKGIPSILFPAVRPIPNAKQVILPLREDTVEVIRKNGLYDVILLDGKGFITEGSRSNVFFINDDKIYTPPVHQILPGITREKIFEICRNHNISIQEKKNQSRRHQ